MTKHPQPQHGRPAGRGARQAPAPPQTSPGTEPRTGTPEAPSGESRLMDEHEFKRCKELNPDDFE
ncbi:MAG: hypothetical protein DIU60_014545 [Actinomycetes bacterium]|jgi:hypothetical protein|nr:MAG: hypothetical protein DIU60_13790 [Actinomycetota bacterium]